MFGKKVKIAEMTTILGKGTVVNGDFTAASSARVDGIIEGDVKVAGLLIVGESGQIHGNIEAASITVGGEVLGDATLKVVIACVLLLVAVVCGVLNFFVLLIAGIKMKYKFNIILNVLATVSWGVAKTWSR